MHELAQSGDAEYVPIAVNRRYRACHLKYRIVQIVVASYNLGGVEIFYCAEVYMGILVASCAVFASITMFGTMHPLVYLALPLLALSCFSIAIVLTQKKLASIWNTEISFDATGSFLLL